MVKPMERPNQRPYPRTAGVIEEIFAIDRRFRSHKFFKLVGDQTRYILHYGRYLEADCPKEGDTVFFLSWEPPGTVLWDGTERIQHELKGVTIINMSLTKRARRKSFGERIAAIFS